MADPWQLYVTCERCGAPVEPRRPAVPHETAVTLIVRCTAMCEPGAEFRLSARLKCNRPFLLQDLVAFVVGPRDPGRAAYEDTPERVLSRRLAGPLGVTEWAMRRRVYRWLPLGLTVTEADELATALGYHPSAVWPHWWSVAGEGVLV